LGAVREGICSSRFTAFGLLAGGLGILLACAPEPQFPEDEDRALLAEIAVEERDLNTLKGFVSDDYADERGDDKRAIHAILAYHFLRNRSVHLLTRVQSVTVLAPERAQATLLVAMAGRRIQSAEQLVGLRADLFRFEFALVREGRDWRVESAAWRRAERNDFF
jgi:hypothetical protein